MGEPVRLRTLSMPVMTDVRPISCTASYTLPASSIVMPRSWMLARVVMSPQPFSPYGRMHSASLRSCVEVSSPLGTCRRGGGGGSVREGRALPCGALLKTLVCCAGKAVTACMPARPRSAAQ